MIIERMSIRLETDKGIDCCYSPYNKEKKTKRMKLGWLFVRIGAYVMFGKGWLTEIEDLLLRS